MWSQSHTHTVEAVRGVIMVVPWVRRYWLVWWSMTVKCEEWKEGQLNSADWEKSQWELYNQLWWTSNKYSVHLSHSWVLLFVPLVLKCLRNSNSKKIYGTGTFSFNIYVKQNSSIHGYPKYLFGGYDVKCNSFDMTIHIPHLQCIN